MDNFFNPNNNINPQFNPIEDDNQSVSDESVGSNDDMDTVVSDAIFDRIRKGEILAEDLPYALHNGSALDMIEPITTADFSQLHQPLVRHIQPIEGVNDFVSALNQMNVVTIRESGSTVHCQMVFNDEDHDNTLIDGRVEFWQNPQGSQLAATFGTWADDMIIQSALEDSIHNAFYGSDAHATRMGQSEFELVKNNLKTLMQDPSGSTWESGQKALGSLLALFSFTKKFQSLEASAKHSIDRLAIKSAIDKILTDGKKQLGSEFSILQKKIQKNFRSAIHYPPSYPLTLQDAMVAELAFILSNLPTGNNNLPQHKVNAFFKPFKEFGQQMREDTFETYAINLLKDVQFIDTYIDLIGQDNPLGPSGLSKKQIEYRQKLLSDQATELLSLAFDQLSGYLQETIEIEQGLESLNSFSSFDFFKNNKSFFLSNTPLGITSLIAEIPRLPKLVDALIQRLIQLEPQQRELKSAEHTCNIINHLMYLPVMKQHFSKPEYTQPLKQAKIMALECHHVSLSGQLEKILSRRSSEQSTHHSTQEPVRHSLTQHHPLEPSHKKLKRS